MHTTNSAVALLAALAHTTRLEVFRLLVQAGPTGLAPGAIAEQLGLAPATLSFHLKELKFAGAVLATRNGRSLSYRPNFDEMQSLIDFLSENCCCGCAPAEQARS